MKNQNRDPNKCLLIEDVREFSERWGVIARKCEQDEVFPRDIYNAIGQKKWLGPFVPQEYGGFGGGVSHYVILEEEFSRRSIPVIGIQIQCEKLLLEFGTEEQKRKYLPQLSSGELISSTAITEPEGGSKLYRLSTVAERRGDYIEISGKKTHINLAAESDVMIILVQTGKGPSFVLYDKKEAGHCDIEYRRLKPTALKSSPVYNVFYRSLLIPKNSIIGEEGMGFEMIKKTFNVSRLGNAAFFIGRSKQILANALQYANRRNLSETSVVSDYQGIQWLVSEMAIKIKAASLLLKDAVEKEEKGLARGLETSMAKLFAADLGSELAFKIISLVGSQAVFENQPYAGFLQEMAMFRVAGGSLEVLKNHVGKSYSRNPDLLFEC